MVVDTLRSPYCRLRPLPLAAVRLEDEFWAPRLRLNREVTLPAQYEQCEQTGRIDNFRRAAGKKQIPFQGIYYNDSDVYKVIEGAAYALNVQPDPELEAYVDGLIAKIGAAQEADGYLYTTRTIDPEHPHRWAGTKR